MTKYIDGLYVAEHFDDDGDLNIGDSYLNREALVELRDHLTEMLGLPETQSEIAAALRDVANAIRSISPDADEPKHTTVLTGNIGGVAATPTLLDRIAQFEEPQGSDDPDAWNRAAIDLAFRTSRFVTFDYRRTAFSQLVESQEKVLPLGPVQVTGPTHDPYAAVMCRRYEDDTFIIKTYRIERIEGYVKLLSE